MIKILLKSLFFIVILSHVQMHAQHDWTRTNPGGGGAISMVGATANGTLVAGSDLSGVYIKKPNSSTWKPLGATQGLMHSSVTTFGFHPTDGNTFIIGTTIGAYKTKDGGETIYPVQIETDPNLGLGYVESIGMAISDPLVGYMAHHEYWVPPLSFLKTMDGGESWNLVTTSGIPEKARITKLIVDQNNANLVYAVTGKGRVGCSLPNLYKSIDGGQNWIEIGPKIGTDFEDILDIDLHPTNPDVIYVSTFEANDCGVHMWQYPIGGNDAGAFYKSVDGGTSFTQLSERTGIISIGENPNDISLINILTLDPDNPDSGTWRTTDGGTVWNHAGHVRDWNIGRANPSPSFAFALSFNGIAKTLTKNRFNPQNLNGSFGQWVWTSTDGGNTINNVNSIEVSPDFFISTGVENIEGNAIDVNDTNPNTIYVGYYDLGVFYSKNHGASWHESIPDNSTYSKYSWFEGGGSNCNTVLSDPSLDNVVWASFSADQPITKSAIFKSTNYGETWVLSNAGLDPFGETTHGLSIDKQSPIDARVLFVTQKGNVYKSTDGGANWVQKSTVGGLKFTAIDTNNSQLVYAGGENGLWRSNDGGETWSEKGLPEMHGSSTIPGLVMNKEIVPTYAYDHDNIEATPELAPWRGVFEIKADPTIADRVYVVAYGEDKGLYRSNDAGETWKKIYTNDEMRGVAIAPDNSEVVYASASQNYHSGYPSEGYKATDGIVITYNASAETPTWADVTDGMAWANGGRMEIEKGANPNIWAWSPGTGVQYAKIPNFTTDVEPCEVVEIVPEYTIDGVTNSGTATITIQEGQEVILSILPDDIGLTITLPDGTEVDDNHNLGNVNVEQSGVYTFTSEDGCVAILEIEVSPSDDCPASQIIPEYSLNGTWASGQNDLTVTYGTEVVLSILPNTVSVGIQLPDGSEVGDNFNLGAVTPENNGTYLLTSSEGCQTTINLTVEDQNCEQNQIIPEYSLDGTWDSGLNNLTVEEGTEVVFSILPNNIPVTLQLPDGTEVGDNFNLGAVTPGNNGTYLLTSAEGCQTTINLTVEGEEDCEPGQIIPEYQLNGAWSSGLNDLTVYEGTEVLFSMLPNHIDVTVELPDGTVVGDNFNLGAVTSSNNGAYILTSSEGCRTTINLTVEDLENCQPDQIIPEYRLDGIWSSGQNDLTVVSGTEVVFSMLPNNIGVTVEFPNGTVVGDNHNIGAVTVEDSGAYILTSAEGCRTIINLTVESQIETASDSDTGKPDNTSIVYPNPTAEILNLKLENFENQQLVATLFNSSGQLVAKRIFNNDHGELEQLDLNNLPSGLYHLILQSSSERKVHSILVN